MPIYDTPSGGRIVFLQSDVGLGFCGDASDPDAPPHALVLFSSPDVSPATIGQALGRSTGEFGAQCVRVVFPSLHSLSHLIERLQELKFHMLTGAALEDGYKPQLEEG